MFQIILFLENILSFVVAQLLERVLWLYMYVPCVLSVAKNICFKIVFTAAS